MKLPNYEKAFVPKEKITNYLLSLIHRDGCSKARFFMRFGFSAEQWETLTRALKFHAGYNEITKTEISYFGTRYIIEGAICSPDRRNPSIRSVWFVENGSDIPCFVTAYPVKGKKND
ncbi:MAG: hypothetical protein HQK77_10140 [Desulfobacterales bacterium]|nr:hypothetical protein [Desulfobacterales bacterium]